MTYNKPQNISNKRLGSLLVQHEAVSMCSGIGRDGEQQDYAMGGGNLSRLT